MAVINILVNFLLLALLLCLPFLMVALTYNKSTDRSPKLTRSKFAVFSAGALCAPLAIYVWLYQEATTPTSNNLFENIAALHDRPVANAAPVENLKFSDFFILPIGPHGLEITQRLSALDGKKVRIKGYMVQQELAKPGFFLLTALPTKTTEADDSMADDLPPSTVFVHVHSNNGQTITHRPGLLEFTGFLSVGPKEESDTRVSSVRLMLDSASSRAMIASN